MIANTRRIQAGAGPFAILLFLLASVPLQAQAPVSLPSSAPVTLPASAPASNPFDFGPATRKAIAPLPKAKTVEEGIKYDQDEREILSAVKDHTRRLPDPGLSVLLRRAAAMPELDSRTVAMLNQLSCASLAKSPEKYRGDPIRMTIRVYKMRQYTPGKEFPFTDRWPRDKPIWWLGGTEGAYGSKDAKRIIALSIVDPTEALSPQVQPDKDGEYVYENGRAIELAGIFYKTYSDLPATAQSADDPLKDYPVIVAWQLGEGIGGGFSWGGIGGMALIAVVMVAVLVVLIYFGNRLRSSLKGGAQGGKRFQEFRHKRIEKIREAAVRDDDEKVEEVDQALKAAAEQFKKDTKA